MFKYILFALILLIGLSACSERYPNSPYTDDNGNGTTAKVRYFPVSIGSYWIYETYQLDTMNRVDKTTKSFDSIFVEADIVKANKKAKYFIKYSKTTGNYQKSGEDFFALEGNKLYTLQTYLSKFFRGVPFQLANFSSAEWIKIVDHEDDLWRIYRMKLVNTTIPNLPFVTLNGKIDVLASYEGKKKLNIDGKSIEADEFLITFEFDADMNVPFVGVLNIGIERELYQYYANDIGLVYENLNSSALSFPLIGNINLPGYESKLIRYNIK